MHRHDTHRPGVWFTFYTQTDALQHRDRVSPSSGKLAPVSALDILALAAEEQDRARAMIAGLGPCPIRLSRATTELGSFSVDERSGSSEIRISRHITDEVHVRETARHELAHQAAWERYRYLGHGALWQTLAVYVGCEPVPCGGLALDPDVVRARQRFIVMCRACGMAVARQRRSKLVKTPWRFACARCKGRLSVVALAAPPA